MPLSRKQKALIHVAKTKLELTEEMYRSALVEIGGVSNLTELDIAGFEALMGFFEYLGFKPLTAKGANYGDRQGMASFAQIEFIRTLWREYTRGASDEDGLNKWLESKWNLSSLRFLGKDKAPKIITALKAMKSRAA